MSWKSIVIIANASPLPPNFSSPSFYCWADTIWYRITLWPAGIKYPGCVPSQDLAHSQPCWSERVRLELQPWCCASTAQPKPKHWCVLPTPSQLPLQSTAGCGLLWGKLTPSVRPNTTGKRQIEKIVFTFYWRVILGGIIA